MEDNNQFAVQLLNMQPAEAQDRGRLTLDQSVLHFVCSEQAIAMQTQDYLYVLPAENFLELMLNNVNTRSHDLLAI